MPSTLSTSSQQQQFLANVHHAIQETLKQYQIQLELCMSDQPFMSGFFDFLKHEHNSGSLEFVMSVDEFAFGKMMVRPMKNTLFSNSSLSPSSSPTSGSSSSSSSSPLKNLLKTKSKNSGSNNGASSTSTPNNSSSVHNIMAMNRKQKAKEIISRFMDDYSPYQVNLSYPVKENIIRNFEKECLRPDNEIDPHLFDEARVEISLQLNCDSFVRFVKSRQFIQFITEMVLKDVSSHNMDLVYKYLSSYFSKIGEKKLSITRKGSNSPSTNSPSALSPTSSDTSPNTNNNNNNNEDDIISSQTTSMDEEVASIHEQFRTLMACINCETVDDRHFDLVHAMINLDKLWTLVSETQQSLTYVSESKFYHNNRGLKIIKEVGILEATPEEVLFATLDMRILGIVDEMMTQPSCVKFVQNDKYAMSYLSSRLKLVWPLTDRHFVIGSSVREEHDNFTGYTIVRKSLESNDITVFKGCVQAIFLGGVVIERVNEKHTRITLAGFLDMGGKFPVGLFNKLLATRGSKRVENFLKGILKRREMSEEERRINSENSCRVIETLIYSKSNQQRNE
ncbi:hypothetical protein C9374_008021 [Naegleria lovaniensis]|uniref:RGS domain-containing protein n=1 Tax=Naegleria lovaniensis TaxID=51637 RepID=A0AA88GHW2_NAELO|nr:uncharacterized protein C9374_008021 [Naegleria lovaniensis]KAG2378873.1 hypothetical protein C9374_008021 [Naegleria lovaniensis]